ncbi:MAG: hypothetical protein WCB15_28755 [Desulfobacterales bacterium]
MQLFFERDTVIAAASMGAALPVLPAILKAFKNRSTGLLVIQFGWNSLAAVLEKKQKIFNRNGVISP